MIKKKKVPFELRSQCLRGGVPQRGAGCQHPLPRAMSWEDGGHSHQPCNKMLHPCASTMLLEGACFLSQANDAVSPLHEPLQNQIVPSSLGVSVDFRKLYPLPKIRSSWSLQQVQGRQRQAGFPLPAPPSACVLCPSVSGFATSSRAGFLLLPEAQGLCL